MKNFKLLSVFGLVLLTGCSAINQSRKGAGISRQELFTTKADGKVLPTLFWSHYDATQRGGIYLVNPDGSVRIISENPPDAVINSTIDALAKVKVTDEVDIEAKFGAVKAVAELGQRNAGTYMIRDLAFRIEALKNNHDGEIDKPIMDIYKKLIESAENITITDSKVKMHESKASTIKELTSLIKMSKDTLYKDLKIDADFIKKISEYIGEK
jgi:hypothetical protein